MLKINVFGLVQGVGFRNFVYTCANMLGILGTVENKGLDEVETFAEGNPDDLEIFSAAVALGPQMSRVDEISIIEEDNKGFKRFETILPPPPLRLGSGEMMPSIPACDLCDQPGVIYIYTEKGVAWNLCFTHANLFSIR